MITLPITYALEVYEKSFRSDPVARYESLTPFLAIAKGNRLDLSGEIAWYYPPRKDQYLCVKDVNHLIGQLPNTLLHTLMVCVELANKQD